MRVVAPAPDPDLPLLRLAVHAPGGEREPPRARRERGRAARRRRQLPRLLDASRRDHPERGLGRLRRARSAVGRDEPVGVDLLESRARLAREAAILRLPARRRLQPRDARRGQRRRHARARVLAPARDPRRGADAVLRRPDRRRGSREALASRPRTLGRSRLRVAADDAREPEGEYHSSECRPGGALRPPPGHARLAEQLELPRWTNTHGRPSPGSGELRLPATTNMPSSTSGSESGVLGAGGGPSREISS